MVLTCNVIAKNIKSIYNGAEWRIDVYLRVEIELVTHKGLNMDKPYFPRSNVNSAEGQDYVVPGHS